MKKLTILCLALLAFSFIFAACNATENLPLSQSDTYYTQTNQLPDSLGSSVEEPSENIVSTPPLAQSQDDMYHAQTNQLSDFTDSNQTNPDAGQSPDSPNASMEQPNGNIRTVHTHSFVLPYASVNCLDLASGHILRIVVLDARVERLNIALPPIDLHLSQEEIDWWVQNEEIHELYRVYTIYRVKVLESFKGMQPDEIIEVRQPGGQVDNLRVVNRDKILIEVGEEFIVFLYDFDREAYSAENMPDWVPNRHEIARRVQSLPFSVSHPQRVFRIPAIREGDNIMTQKADIALEGVHPDNFPVNLVVTMGDLQRIARANP